MIIWKIAKTNTDMRIKDLCTVMQRIDGNTGHVCTTRCANFQWGTWKNSCYMRNQEDLCFFQLKNWRVNLHDLENWRWPVATGEFVLLSGGSQFYMYTIDKHIKCLREEQLAVIAHCAHVQNVRKCNCYFGLKFPVSRLLKKQREQDCLKPILGMYFLRNGREYVSKK